MALRAIAGRRVIGILCLGRAGHHVGNAQPCLATFMTGRTIAGNARVIHQRARTEYYRRQMANAAIGGCRDVIGGAAHGDRAIVAGGAGTQHLRVIHRDLWFPDQHRMAGLTAVAGVDVIGRFYPSLSCRCGN